MLNISFKLYFYKLFTGREFFFLLVVFKMIFISKILVIVEIKRDKNIVNAYLKTYTLKH